MSIVYNYDLIRSFFSKEHAAFVREFSSHDRNDWLIKLLENNSDNLNIRLPEHEYKIQSVIEWIFMRTLADVGLSQFLSVLDVNSISINSWVEKFDNDSIKIDFWMEFEGDNNKILFMYSRADLDRVTDKDLLSDPIPWIGYEGSLKYSQEFRQLSSNKKTSPVYYTGKNFMFSPEYGVLGLLPGANRPIEFWKSLLFFSEKPGYYSSGLVIKEEGFNKQSSNLTTVLSKSFSKKNYNILAPEGEFNWTAFPMLLKKTEEIVFKNLDQGELVQDEFGEIKLKDADDNVMSFAIIPILTSLQLSQYKLSDEALVKKLSVLWDLPQDAIALYPGGKIGSRTRDVSGGLANFLCVPPSKIELARKAECLIF